MLVHQSGKGYEVEFITLDGETVAVASLYSVQVRPIGSREIAKEAGNELMRSLWLARPERSHS